MKDAHMWDEDELPDGDLESVYGREAVTVRIFTQMAAMQQRLDALLDRTAPRETPPQNSP